MNIDFDIFDFLLKLNNEFKNKNYFDQPQCVMKLSGTYKIFHFGKSLI